MTMRVVRAGNGWTRAGMVKLVDACGCRRVPWAEVLESVAAGVGSGVLMGPEAAVAAIARQGVLNPSHSRRPARRRAR